MSNQQPHALPNPGSSKLVRRQRPGKDQAMKLGQKIMKNSKAAMIAAAFVLFFAPNCLAQKTKIWTRDNIQEWIDSNAQTREKRNLIRSVSGKERKKLDRVDWFFPPTMKMTSSRPGQLGRMVFPAYKVIEILDEKRVVFEVVDQPGQRYLAVFDLGDTSRIRVDNRAHESPVEFSLVLFERVDNYKYRNANNIRSEIPMFRKVDPADVMKGKSE